MKPLLVGEAPGPNGDPEKPLEGRPAGLLLACMGIQGPRGGPATVEELTEHFEIRNLIDRPMERKEGSKGTEWSEEEAAEAAGRLVMLLERAQSVVLLGKRVSTAFSMPHAGFTPAPNSWWVWRTDPNFKTHWVMIPHPSGIVRTWNDPVTRVRAGMALWQALGKIDR